MIFLFRLLFATVVLGAAFPARAQEAPYLVAGNLQNVLGWCGERFIRARQANNEILIDLHTRTHINLEENGLPERFGASMQSCSPDGRWVIVQGGRAWEDHGDCITVKKFDLPEVYLWDAVARRRYSVGRGYFGLEWSPDSRRLLYRLIPNCEQERDARAWLRISQGDSDFRALSAYDLVKDTLKTDGSWLDRIGAMSWLDSNRFLVQLPSGRAAETVAGGIVKPDAGFQESSDYTRNGAIVLVSVAEGQMVRVEQLDPAGFRSTLKLAVPQHSPARSRDLVLESGCRIERSGLEIRHRDGSVDELGDEGMTCLDRSGPPAAGQSNAVELDVRRYCATLKAGDVQQFCDPERASDQWFRTRRGQYVVLERIVDSVQGASLDLFVIENDAGGYLK